MESDGQGLARLPSLAGVRRRVVAAVRACLGHDGDLLDRNANERSIAHKLAEYLQREFKSFAVDVEYNRHGDKEKRLQYSLEAAGNPVCKRPPLVLPDIVVHRRGPDAANLLVIEVKKRNGDPVDTDVAKLKGYTGPQYGYHHGLLLVLDMEHCRIDQVRYFQRGAEQSSKAWDELLRLKHVQ